MTGRGRGAPTDRRSKKSCSHRTDLLPIYHGWKLEQEALAGIGVRKVSPSRRLNKESAPSLARLQNFQRFSPPTITLRWKMTTALLPARHGSFVIYRPLRFHVIQIFPLAFSKRLRGPIDRSRGYFSIPLSIVSLVKIYPLHGRRQVSPHGVSSTARGVSIRSTLAYLPYPSRRSYRHSSMMKTENLRGDPFFQRGRRSRGTGACTIDSSSLFPTNWKRARRLKWRSNMNPWTRRDLYVFKRNSH